MSPVPDRSEIDALSTFLSDRFGFSFSDHKRDELAELLTDRLRKSECASCEAYLTRLRSDPGASEELRVLADSLTVGETYFFRYPEQYRALAEVSLPELLQSKEASREIRILSAGCASGEEPYTIAMVLCDQIPNLDDWRISVQGIDINRISLAKARKGRYHRWSLRATPESRMHHFRRIGDTYLVNPHVRSMVSFEQQNLTVHASDFWERQQFDVVFCRNVMIYLTQEAARFVVRRLAQSIPPGGYLFLGHADVLPSDGTEFRRCQTHDVIYYQRLPVTATPTPVRAHQARPVVTPIASEPMPPLAQNTAPPVEPHSSEIDVEPMEARTEGNFDPILAALAEDRFEDARRLIHALPLTAQDDAAEIQLLLSVAFVNSGDVGAAETVLRSLLAHDDLNPGAYHLLAVCREHWGDNAAARSFNEQALYLNPSFALAHLQLGRLARQAGDLPNAAKGYRHALELLSREEPILILLFGGGFPKEVLIRLCQDQLCSLGKTI